MMKLGLSTDSPTHADVDLLAVGVRSGARRAEDDAFRRLDRAMGGALAQHAEDEDFMGFLEGLSNSSRRGTPP